MRAETESSDPYLLQSKLHSPPSSETKLNGGNKPQSPTVMMVYNADLFASPH